MEDPLHSFELHTIVPLSLFGLDVSINKAVIMMFLVVGLVTLLLTKARSSGSLIPTKLQSVAELLVEFIRGMIHETMGPDGMRFFPLIATLFLFILFCNLLGLMPGAYTVTSQIVVTGRVCSGGLFAQSPGRIQSTRDEVSGDPRSVGDAGLAVAAHDSH